MLNWFLILTCWKHRATLNSILQPWACTSARYHTATRMYIRSLSLVFTIMNLFMNTILQASFACTLLHSFALGMCVYLHMHTATLVRSWHVCLFAHAHVCLFACTLPRFYDNEFVRSHAYSRWHVHPLVITLLNLHFPYTRSLLDS